MSKRKSKITKKKRSSLQKVIQNKFFFIITVILFLVIGSFSYSFFKHYNQNVLANTPSRPVVGWLVYWDKDRGLQSIQNNSNAFTEISLWAYTIDNNGNVILDPAGGASITDDTTLNTLRSIGKRVTPAVHNLVGGDWNGVIMHDILTDATKSSNLRSSIISLINSKGYDGVDIDFENLQAGDRDLYSEFIKNLSSDIHAIGKTISVDVYGKTSEPGGWNGPQAQDYAALGSSVDQVRIFLYDYNPGAVGPIAPYNWVNDVLSFAKTKIPAEKIIHGIPLYGYDWRDGNPSDRKDYTWEQATSAAQANDAVITFDLTEHAPTYVYSDRTVWFENAQSTSDKLDLTLSQNIGGIQLWRLGGEDPGIYEVIQSKLISPTPTLTPSEPSHTPTTTATPTLITSFTPTPTSNNPSPIVVITKPLNEAIVARKQSINVTASDNKKVTKVEFYTDGVLRSTDMRSSYSWTWDTTRVSKGAHIIKVIAYDNQGASTSKQITVYK